MANPNPIIEGVFAIHKPGAISSAQVLRDLQSHLNPSKTFAPWINAERQRREDETANQKGKRSRRNRGAVQVKMGHGGTLDPMATGVLIVGVGTGTKSLQAFLDGTKTYEAVLVFGAATDTYDYEGKIVKRAPYEHITKAAFEEALNKFRGPIMQKPPIFSALRVQGKRLYEYAREGKELPVEIQERPVTVSELECVEWMEPGTHNYNYPSREAELEEKDVADKLLGKAEDSKIENSSVQDLKRKREQEDDTSSKKLREDETAAASATETPSTKPEEAESTGTAQPESEPAKEHPPCPAPAARIRMTVSSGFYVRSLCHDLGAQVGSLAFMAELARIRQSMFEVGKNVLEYDDLAKGEDVWGPKITGMLADWNNEHPDGYERQSQPAKRQNGNPPKKHRERPSWKGGQQPEQRDRQRNSSSPEA